MDPSPPQPPRKPKENRPFYAPQVDKPLAVQIINEARSSLKELKTKRPFTPRDDRRTLFGPRPLNTSDNRPPSAFSLDSRHFDPESRPVSGTRLSPLDHKPSLTNKPEDVVKFPTEAEVESLLLPPRPPNDSSKPVSRKGNRARLQHANSVDTSSFAENSGGLKAGKSTSSSDVSKDSSYNSPESVRRVHSGPKERTQHVPVEERGEGDGIEAPPHRAPSSAAVTAPVRNELEERLGSGGTKRTNREGEERVGSGGTKRTSSAGSRGGSAGRREEDGVDEQVFYLEQVVPLLDEMAEYSKKKDSQMIITLSDDLFKILQDNGLFCKNYKQRSTVLKAIFKMLDLEEPKLLLRLARLILAFRVGGNNLLNVCKLVFKVSRNEKNDPAFLEGNILELLLETMMGADLKTCQEALIYCIGALKFLTGNATIAKQLVHKDCIEKLSVLLTSINKHSTESAPSVESLSNVLVQLTAALRNLADATSSRDRILSCHLLNSLCLASNSFSADAEIILNVSRIFSKVTLHTDCCMALSEETVSYKVFLHLIKKHIKRQDIVVRICFILGNMTAKNDEARVRLYQETKSLDVILTVLKTYLELDIRSRSGGSQKKEKPKSEGNSSDEGTKTEDVLVKVVRVIANISINETVGPKVAASLQCVDLLLNILDCREIETNEELVLNTVSCINNLSYFSCKNSAVTTRQFKIIDSLMKLILAENMMKSIVEVCRVFGNLTRQKQVRDYLRQRQVDVLLITLLDSGDKEVVYIACGVLINFMVDEDKRGILKSEGGITKLVEVLRDFGRGDWELAAMVCQTLWNYSGKITSTNACFGDHDAQELAEILIDFLDKQSAFDSELSEMDPEFQDYIIDTWETQFCPVGDQLLQRIETHSSDFESLPGTSS